MGSGDGGWGDATLTLNVLLSGHQLITYWLPIIPGYFNQGKGTLTTLMSTSNPS